MTMVAHSSSESQSSHGNRVSLDDAVKSALALGFTADEVPEYLRRSLGDEWVSEELFILRDRIVRQRAVQFSRAETRRIERVLRPGDVRSQGEIRIRKYAVPMEDGSWRLDALGRFTPEDLRRKAAWARGISGTLVSWAEWAESIADLADRQGVEMIGEIVGDLPAMPEIPREIQP